MVEYGPTMYDKAPFNSIYKIVHLQALLAINQSGHMIFDILACSQPMGNVLWYSIMEYEWIG